MQLLQDIFIVENLQILTEGKNNDVMKIRGVFGRCNEKNNNGRIYPTAVLESQLQKVKPLIAERRLCGELDHPQNDTVKLSNASHLVTKLEMKGDDLIGEAEILKTPAGLTAKALVEGGVKIGISSRGMGTLSEDHNGDKIVNEDFRLVTFDLVADPSTRGAFPCLSESTQSQFARESQSKLGKEQNFVTMLQSKLRDAYEPWIEEATKKKAKKKKLAPKGPTDDGDGMDPVGQGDADIDNDGDSDSSDAYLKKRRKTISKAMAFESVKREGSWHKIAYAIAEAFADELDKTTVGQASAEGDTKAPTFMQRRGVSKGKKSAARADVKAAGIRQKGAIKLADRATKAKARAARGEEVTTGGRALAAGKKLAGKAGSAIKARLDKQFDKGDKKPAPDATPTPQQSALADVQSGGPKAPAPKAPAPKAEAPKAPAPKGPAFGAGVGEAPKPKPKPEPEAAENLNKRGQQSADAQAQRGKDAKRLRALRAAGTGPAATKRAQTSKGALARNRQKKYGKEAGEIGISAGTEYIRWGRMLAESFGLAEDAQAGYPGVKGGTKKAAAMAKKLSKKS